ncbi:MAG: hypothetical protein LRY36_00705 [Alphaproteobacteria bacterium]|nr:hypothetical protein [Alphaproteobacteria bacterium]
MKALKSRYVLMMAAVLALVLPAYCAFAVELFEPHVPDNMEKRSQLLIRRAKTQL